MSDLLEQIVACPYCGESIDVLIEPSEAQQEYIEDCQVCCRPIRFSVAADYDGSIDVSVNAENE